MVFPSEDESATPMDFVPAGSDVTCGIECKYIWLGAKGWGISWALKQTVVVPKYSENTTGKLQLEVHSSTTAQSVASSEPKVEEQVTEEKTAEATNYVEDSDNEAEKQEASEETKEEVQTEPEVVEEPPAPKKKTVVKKAEKPVEETPVEAAPAPVKKKVVRKKT
jgi:hypothetical protein